MKDIFVLGFIEQHVEWFFSCKSSSLAHLLNIDSSTTEVMIYWTSSNPYIFCNFRNTRCLQNGQDKKWSWCSLAEMRLYHTHANLKNSMNNLSNYMCAIHAVDCPLIKELLCLQRLKKSKHTFVTKVQDTSTCRKLEIIAANKIFRLA